MRLPTPPLEDLSELVNFDEPDIAYEELAQVRALIAVRYDKLGFPAASYCTPQ